MNSGAPANSVVITCGPAYEPIDEVRRITNFSTGELGTLLADRLTNAGVRVICFRGASATYPRYPVAAEVRPFTTNEDLQAQLARLPAELSVQAVFHAAALCDFRVRRVEDPSGTALSGAKINSASGLTLHLEPAAKVINSLRAIFPRSLLIGWKYELEGDRETALERGRRQIEKNGTDACVVNGRAYGPGFAYQSAAGPMTHLSDKLALCDFLATLLAL